MGMLLHILKYEREVRFQFSRTFSSISYLLFPPYVLFGLGVRAPGKIRAEKAMADPTDPSDPSDQAILEPH